MAAVSAPPVVALRNILVATDFSACSQTALHTAAALARQATGKIFLAHVICPEPTYSIPLDKGPACGEIAVKEAYRIMQQHTAAPELHGVEHTTLVQHGDLWPALQLIIDENDIDLLVVGTHGREGLTKLVLGSAAEEVFRRAPCPVLTVGPHVGSDCVDHGRLRRLVFATDLSASSMRAVAYVTLIAQQHQAQVTFLHVLASAVPDAEFGATTYVERELEEARDNLRDFVPAGINADVVVEVGIPAEIIVRVARAQEAGLIVMGLHPQSVFAATHLPWTTAHRVVCDAHCPVLTVR